LQTFQSTSKRTVHVKGVLFDLYHTLTDIESKWSDLPWTADVLGIERAEWNAALTERSGWRLCGEVKDARQIIATLARELRPHISDAIIDRAVAVRVERFRHTFQRIPAENVLLIDELRRRGISTALVSNADAMEVSGYAGSPLAGRFDVELFSCEVSMVKPEPEIYEHALRQVNLDASECIFVGDGGSNDLEGARAVGLVLFLFVCMRSAAERTACAWARGSTSSCHRPRAGSNSARPTQPAAPLLRCRAPTPLPVGRSPTGRRSRNSNTARRRPAGASCS
jgi:putative hydrolase of the HAD superfamily